MDYDFPFGTFLYSGSDNIGQIANLLTERICCKKDLTIDLDGAEPKILIYHTHSQEGYADSEAAMRMIQW